MEILNRCFRIVPVALIMGTIFFLSHQPGTELQFHFIAGFDKLAHGLMYAVLAAAALYAIPRKKLQSAPVRSGFLVVLFCLIYGLTDEYHQSFIPSREPSLGDIVADGAGAVVMVLLWLRYFTCSGQQKCQPAN